MKKLKLISKLTASAIAVVSISSMLSGMFTTHALDLTQKTKSVKCIVTASPNSNITHFNLSFSNRKKETVLSNTISYIPNVSFSYRPGNENVDWSLGTSSVEYPDVEYPDNSPKLPSSGGKICELWFSVDNNYDKLTIDNLFYYVPVYNMDFDEFLISYKNILMGDIDGNGSISLSDTKILNNYLLGAITLTENQGLAADVNNDGILSILDKVKLQQYLNGTINTLF